MDTVVLRNKIKLFFSFFKRKKVVISMLSIFFMLGVLVLGVYYIKFRQNTSVHAQEVQLQFVTTSTSVKNGDEFNVDIYIDTKGMSVTGSDIRVRYDPALLQAESVNPGNFLPVVFVPQKISSGFAQIILGCNPTDPKNGNGILESIKFKAIGQGATANIYFGPASAISALGQTTNVLGTSASLNINIAPGATGSPTATPTSTPNGSPTPTPTGGAKIGDINGDGMVNIVDIGIIIDNYGKNPIPNPKADLNHDGIINIVDIGIVIDNYGK